MNSSRSKQTDTGLLVQADALQAVALGSEGAVDGDCLLGGAGARMPTRRPEDEGAGGRDASPLKQDLQPRDCAGAVFGVKRLATLQAKLAQAGFSLTQAADGYYVIDRWNQTRHLDTPQQVEQFSRRVAP